MSVCTNVTDGQTVFWLFRLVQSRFVIQSVRYPWRSTKKSVTEHKRHKHDPDQVIHFQYGKKFKLNLFALN
jgi:hypothetical protein